MTNYIVVATWPFGQIAVKGAAPMMQNVKQQIHSSNSSKQGK
jgi:hypothetical protein